MSNPTELPDLDKLLADYGNAAGRYTVLGDVGSHYNDMVGARNAIRDLFARRAQPEGEAPQDDLTRRQKENAEFSEWWASSGQQTTHDLITENAAHATWQERARRAATLSPLCGAQHAESGAEAKPMFDVETRDELTDAQNSLLDHSNTLQELLICFMSWEPQVCVLGNVRADKAAAAIRAALAAQQAAAQGTVTDYGTSAPGTPEAPQPPFPVSDEEMAALRRFWECASDGEGYDVEKTMMQRLAEMGLVQRKSGAYYMVTEFGLYVLREYTIPRAAQLDGGQEGSESNG